MTWDRPRIVLLQRSKKVLQVYFCQDLYTVFQVSRISHKMVVVGYCMIFQTRVCAHAHMCAHVCGACFLFFIFHWVTVPTVVHQVNSLLQVTLQKECCIIPRCFSDASTPVGVFDMTTEHGSVLSLCYKLSGSLSICCFFAQPLCTQFKYMCWFRLAVQWSCLHSRFVTFFILPGITNGHAAKQVCMVLYSRLPSWLCFPLVCSMLKHGLNVLLSWFCDSEQLRRTPCFVIY